MGRHLLLVIREQRQSNLKSMSVLSFILFFGVRAGPVMVVRERYHGLHACVDPGGLYQYIIKKTGLTTFFLSNIFYRGPMVYVKENYNFPRFDRGNIDFQGRGIHWLIPYRNLYNL